MSRKELVIWSLIWMVFGAVLMFCLLRDHRVEHSAEVQRVEVQRSREPSSPCHWAPMIAGGHP